MANQDHDDSSIIVQLKFEKNPITIWKRRYEKSIISMKVVLIDLNRKDSFLSPQPSSVVMPDLIGEDANHMAVDGPSNGNSNSGVTSSDPLHGEDSTQYDVGNDQRVQISVLNENDWEFKPQEQFGHIYKPNRFFWFRAQVGDFDKTAYMVDFYARPRVEGQAYTDHLREGEAIPEHIGSCYILPKNLQNTWGSVTMPIAGNKRQPIGEMTIDYLIIRPLDFPGVKFNAQKSQLKLWTRQGSKLDVGHRGSGNARRTDTVAQVVENTVASFNHAARHGADLVELDVQLSSDKVPVIYHDYTINIALKKRKAAIDDETIQLAVKDLTYQQLQMLKLSPVGKGKEPWDFHETDAPDNQPFPTLKHVFEALEPSCGVNVEIKCPMHRHNGVLEAQPGFEFNEYVDIIVKTVLENAGNRCIVFSCFHPDICTMITLKQDRYPVLFLTQGQTTKWEPYKDMRTSTVQMATYFALSIGLLGINVHAEDLLKERQLIKFVKNHGLVLFCWGADLNSSEVIEEIKKDGVDGVIYDKVDVLNPKPGCTYIAANDPNKLPLREIARSKQESTESDPVSKQGATDVSSLCPKEL